MTTAGDSTRVDGGANAAVAGPPSRAIRGSLDRDRIIAAAVAYIEVNDVAALSMRRLGSVLGVEAMSLYRHVPDRDELLNGVVEAILDELRDDADILDHPTDGWQDFLQRLAHGVRRVALSHPKAFPLVAFRTPQAPWLRPPLRTPDWVESFLSGLAGEGFSDQAAVSAYRGFTSFLLGQLMFEVSIRAGGSQDTPGDEPARDAALADYPSTRRLRGELAADHAAADFDEALAVLLQRITLLRADSRV